MTVLEEAKADMEKWPHLRLGQAVFNAAHRRNPLVTRLTGTVVDPFYDDSKVDSFLARIRELFGVK